MRCSPSLRCLLLLAAGSAASAARSGAAQKAAFERAMLEQEADDGGVKKHHGHRHHHHRRHHKHQGKDVAKHVEAAALVNASNTTEAPQAAALVNASNTTEAAETAIMMKMRKLEKELESKADTSSVMQTGVLQANAPLPENFAELFADSVAKATSCDREKVKVVDTKELVKGQIVRISFKAMPEVVKAVLEQAADGESKLAKGELCPLLVARASDGSLNGQCDGTSFKDERVSNKDAAVAMLTSKDDVDSIDKSAPSSEPAADEPPASEPTSGLDHNLEMPYGDLEPFGREDTAQELTEDSIKETDEMVDQLERAEVAEEKRAVFRALTRLRGAAITSFDGIARSQTSSIDEYNKAHQWRQGHPVQHLANEESDISKWAFPDANL